MTATRYTLRPHPDTPPSNVQGVAFELLQSPDDLMLTIFVAGSDMVRWPGWRTSERVDELWKATCFEIFVKPQGGDGYVEFNFSPSTQWAAYRFDGYRAGMRDFDPGIAPHITRGFEGDAPFAIEVDLDLSAFPATTCHIGLSAVIEELDGTKSYWALTHAPGPPDFHNSDCFVATLPAPTPS